jgi:uncharacterized protein (TIGR03437 family)
MIWTKGSVLCTKMPSACSAIGSKLTFALLLGLTPGIAAAQAAVTATYSDLGSWTAATNSIVSANFEGLAPNGHSISYPPATGLSRPGGFTFTVNTAESNGPLFVEGQGFSYPGVSALSVQQSTLINNNIVVSFPSGITSVAFTFGSAHPPVQFRLASGDVFAPSQSTYPQTSFFGLTSTTALSQIEIISTTGGFDLLSVSIGVADQASGQAGQSVKVNFTGTLYYSPTSNLPVGTSFSGTLHYNTSYSASPGISTSNKIFYIQPGDLSVSLGGGTVSNTFNSDSTNSSYISISDNGVFLVNAVSLSGSGLLAGTGFVLGLTFQGSKNAAFAAEQLPYPFPTDFDPGLLTADPPGFPANPALGNIQITSIVEGGPVSFSCSQSNGPTTVGQSYLSACSASGGTPPYHWTINPGVLPSGLGLTLTASGVDVVGTPNAPGPYSYTVRVQDSSTPSVEVASQTFSGTILPGTSPISVSPVALTFAGQSNGAPTPSQNFTVSSNTSSAASFTIFASTSSGGNWLGVSAPNGQTPATLSVTAFPAGLSPGTYNAQIAITASGSSTPLILPVTFNVLLSALSVSTTSLPSGTVGSSYSAQLTATGGTPPYGPWTLSGQLPPGITFNTSTGTITGTPTTLTGSPFNLYVTVRDSTGNTSPPAALSIAILAPSFGFTSPGTSLTANAGSTTVQTVQTAVQNTGTAAGSFTIATDQPWLTASLNSATGNAIPGATRPRARADLTSATLQPGQTVGVTITASSMNLAPGMYTGHATVTSTTPGIQPATYTVALVVSAVSISITPAAIPLTVTAGLTMTSMAQITTTDKTVSLTVNINVTAGNSWLAADSSSLTNGSAFNIRADATKLSAGNQVGTLYFQCPNNACTAVTVTVNLTVAAGASLSAAPSSLQFGNYNIGGAAPAPLPIAVNSTNPASGLSFTTSLGNNCAWLTLPSSASTPATITASVNTANVTTGNYSCIIAFDSPGVSPAPTVTATLSVGPSNVPSISSVVNDATFEGPITIGSWVAIFGSHLAPAGDSRPWNTSTEIVNGVFPTSLDGTSVTINGRRASIAYISPGQIDLEPPDDTAVGPVQVVVSTAAGGASAPLTVNYAQFAPGLFGATAPYLVAQHADGSYVGGFTGATPAKPGETITLWGTGFGPASPSVPSGQVFSGASKLVNSVTVTIGGQPATVQFAGIVQAGLVQINVQLPSSLSDGDTAVVATVGGLSTQTTGNMISVHN